MLDGKHVSLQDQGKDVITSPAEMNSNEKELIKKVLSCREYKDAFKEFCETDSGREEAHFGSYRFRYYLL